jgi:hypothetical protein
MLNLLLALSKKELILFQIFGDWANTSLKRLIDMMRKA